MKNMIIASLFFLSTLSYSQLTYVPDDNFEQALIDLGYDTPPLDDFVPTANIENVTDLDVGSYGISDLTGIEGFTALTELWCDNNELTQIDLTQNINLTYFVGSQNQLTTVNINNNIQLQSFICVGNQLNQLDTSQNSILESIIILNNQISSLDLTQNPLLVTLSAPDNLISNIDLSQNVLLEFFNLKGNQLIVIDFSLNPELILIFCENNQLESADIRNGNNENINIEGWFRMTNNPNLTCIFVDDIVYSTENWPDIDPTSTFVETQAECDLLATTSFKESNFNLYPNPAINILNIETNTPFSKAEIYTTLGQKVVESSAKSIDISNLNAGLYLIIIEEEPGNTIVRRFIKK
ncbi:MAG: hypothetical protein COB12_02800 [Flavobacterium sp.]|nr:MAG: hypothetical protein COB12_02800 [Flavobacterium sp.]